LADKSKLFWSAQRDDFYAIIRDLELKNITFVIFDFAVIIGSQMIYFYPDLFKQVIVMDIPMITHNIGVNETIRVEVPYGDEMIKTLPEYQQNNIHSFLTNDDELMMYNINTTLGGTSPCADCRIAPNASGLGGRTGWPYYNMVRTDPAWTSDGFNVSLEEWEFSNIPSYPDDLPLLYLYASEFFQNPLFFEWIDKHGDNDGRSSYTRIDDSDHWMVIRQPTVVNNKITEWMISTADATTASSTIENGGEGSSSSVSATIDIDISRTHNINSNINSSDMESSRLTTAHIAVVVGGILMLAVVVVAVVVKQNHDERYSYEKIINEVNV